jgi:hypothetical protein
MHKCNITPQTNNAYRSVKLETAATSHSDSRRPICRGNTAVKRLAWIQKLHGSNASGNTWCPWMTSVVDFLGRYIQTWDQ